MSVETENSASHLDTVKLVLALLLVVSGIAGFYYFGEQSNLLRVIGMLLMFGLAISLVYMTNLGQMFWGFLLGSRVELRKVVWPTKKETIQTTLIVGVMVLFIGILLWMFDSLLMWGISFVTGQGV